MPKVSVIIPTYNRAEFIGRAISSVLTQTFEDFELLVVDDASTDRTRQVVHQIRDDRIRFIAHKANKGGSAARNTGIKQAEGNYIAFLDDDDEWLPNKLQRQVELLDAADQEVGAVYSGFYFVMQQNKSTVKKYLPCHNGVLYHELLAQNLIKTATTVVVREECLEKAGFFDEMLPSCQDWDMWIRIARRHKFVFVKEALCTVYVHGKQISTDLQAKIAGRERMIDKYYYELLRNKTAFSLHLKRVGALCCLANDWKKGMRCFVKSIINQPKQRDSYLLVLYGLVARERQKNLIESTLTTRMHGIQLF
jgi:glycosyltransferase involved in cell wall biosynthesis